MYACLFRLPLNVASGVIRMCVWMEFAHRRRTYKQTFNPPVCCRGFAFVRFKDTAQAEAAKAALHETPIGKEGYKYVGDWAFVLFCVYCM